MTTGPHISWCHWSKSYLHDKDVSIEQISECLEFPSSLFISLNAILFCCALLRTTQCSSDPGLYWRGHDRLITPNTEFLMSNYGLPFSASGSISANRWNEGSARSPSATAKYLAQILHLQLAWESKRQTPQGIKSVISQADLDPSNVFGERLCSFRSH